MKNLRKANRIATRNIDKAIIAVQEIIDKMIMDEVIKTPDDILEVVRETKYARATIKLALRAAARSIYFELDPDYDNGIASVFIPDADDIKKNIKAAKRDMQHGRITVHYVDLGNDAYGHGSFINSPVRTEIIKLH